MTIIRINPIQYNQAIINNTTISDIYHH